MEENFVNEPNNSYESSHIKVLEWLEPVRQRPWMYIWSTDSRGLHHMIQEVVDNWVDEAIAGFCNNICLILYSDWYIGVTDDWRWIPVDAHKKTWKSALETVFTFLHAGWKFEKSVYKVSGGLHWVGASVVNALSEHLIAIVYRDWKEYKQEYRRWVPQSDIQVVWESEYTGTYIKFKPDAKIFDTLELNYPFLVSRLKQSAYLTPWVSFTIVDENSWNSERFYFEWGIRWWIKNLVWSQETVSPIFYESKEWKDIVVESSFQFIDSNNDNVLSFVNNIPTTDGGTHVLWFKNALLKVINEVTKEKWSFDKKIWEFQLSDIMNWLYAIISIKIPEPQFEGQTKWRLWNSYVKKEVERIVYEYLKEYFREDDKIFNSLLEKITVSAKARIAARLARETVLRKNVIGWSVLPGKLSDCSIKKKDWTELFIVEGNSAWGSAKQWRDSWFQAILPLRWKILNTEQAVLDRILNNNEIKALITAIWGGIKDSYDEEKLRYDKTIIMTDADVDWSHIRTLLLTFFFRFMRSLIDGGHLYIAVPPIYKFKQWKKTEYIYPPEDASYSSIEKHWFDTSKVQIQRYKGLWEMNPNQLWETTMDPETRKMLQVSIEDAENADRLFRILMWKDISSRKHFILTHAKDVKELDV